MFFQLFLWDCMWLLWIQTSGEMEDSACVPSPVPVSSFQVSGSKRQKELPSEVQHTSLGFFYHFHSYLSEILRSRSQDKKWWKTDWKSESFCSWETSRIIQAWQPWLLGLANFQRNKASMISSLLDTEITSSLSSGSLQRDKHIKPLSHCFSGNSH